MSLGVRRSMINADPLSVACEIFDLLVVIDMSSMFQAEGRSTGEDERQARGAMAVPVRQSTAIKGNR